MNFNRIKYLFTLLFFSIALNGFGQKDSFELDWSKLDLTTGLSKSTTQSHSIRSEIVISVGARWQPMDVLKSGFLVGTEIQNDIAGDEIVRGKIEKLLGPIFFSNTPAIPKVQKPFVSFGLEYAEIFGRFRYGLRINNSYSEFAADHSFAVVSSGTGPNTVQSTIGGTLNYASVELRSDYLMSDNKLRPFIGLGLGANVTNIFALYTEIMNEQIDLRSTRSQWSPVISSRIGIQMDLRDNWTSRLKMNYSMQKALGNELHSAIGVEFGVGLLVR
jgi:hypothetical protein